MRHLLRATSIRVRLLVAYLGVLLAGFAVLTLVAGSQISAAARSDYDQRLINEVNLIAQGIGPYLGGEESSSELDSVIQDFEAQVGGTIKLLNVADDRNDRSPSRPTFRDTPELEAALHGGATIVERTDDQGEPRLYTAASVFAGREPAGMVQLSVPVDNLQRVVLQRWVVLWLLFAVVTALAGLLAIIIARTITQPLYALRDSALQLSRGDFSHRVHVTGKDEIAEVARAFNEMAHQVESMLEEQRAFASNTSHELRTPLTTIRLRSEALRDDANLDADTATRYIAEIDDEVIRLTKLIEDLTLLSRFDAGRAELGTTQIDLGRFAAGLHQQMLPQAAARDITFTLNTPEEALPVHAGLSHLTVVFRNLLDNAIKYTPEGGKITWSLSLGVDGVSSLIEDTGQGVDPEHLTHLFERFYRADRARSRDVPGTGLGLALVKSILDAYGGSISVESGGSGLGTLISVYWPSQPAAPES